MATIRERNGKFQIEVSFGFDIYGKRLRESTTFDPGPGLSDKRRREAARAYAYDFEQKIKNGYAMSGWKVTLKEFTDRWIAEYAPQNLEPGTIEKYQAELDGKILPALGHFKLTELRPHNLNSFFMAMTQDGARKDGKAGGYSKGTITKTKNVLSSVLTTATEWELIETNPMRKVRYKAEDPADKIEFFTPEQTVEFLNYIEKPYKVKTKGHKRTDDTGAEYTVGDYEREMELPEQIKILFNLAIYGGMRKGELLALEWSDFDFENDSVSITKAVSMVANQQITKTPKTKNSRRIVTIPHALSQRVLALQEARIKDQEFMGEDWKGGAWVFIQDNGKQMSYSTPYSAFTDTITRYNKGREVGDHLPVIPFHGLRHTSATLLISSKLDIRTVSGRLGHAQASTTMNYYSHFLQSLDRTASNSLEAMLQKR